MDAGARGPQRQQKVDSLNVEEEVQAVRKALASKKTFVKATKELSQLVGRFYKRADEAGRDSLFGAVQRVATLLRSRYTSTLYWRAGCAVFLSVVRAAAESLPLCIVGT